MQVILDPFNYETFINLPHKDFFPVDAVSLLVSNGAFWVLKALLSSYNFKTFYLKFLIYFLSAYFYS